MLMFYPNDEEESTFINKIEPYVSECSNAVIVSISEILCDNQYITPIISALGKLKIDVAYLDISQIMFDDLLKYDLIIIKGISSSEFYQLLFDSIEKSLQEMLKSKLLVGVTQERISLQKDLVIERNTNCNPPITENIAYEKLNHDLSQYLGKEIKFEKQDDYLEQSVINSFVLLYHNDHYLIDNRKIYAEDNQGGNGLYYVGERSIVFRYAYYLQSFLDCNPSFKEYVVDCEYNRNKERIKDTYHFPNGVIPDLIIHQRGSNDNNLLVMEFKTHWNNNTEHDIDKLNELCGGEYRYKYGISVIIGSDKPDIKLIRDRN